MTRETDTPQYIKFPIFLLDMELSHAEALYAAVEYLQRSHQHLKDQIYTSTPAGSPESTLPQNDPKGVLV